MQLSVDARNARADALAAEVGNAGLLRVYTGSAPASCAAAATGTKLSEQTLGSPFAPAASGGVLSPTLPADGDALVTDTAGYWRVYKAGGTVCVAQGSVGAGSGELSFNSLSFVLDGPVRVLSWSGTEGGA